MIYAPPALRVLAGVAHHRLALEQVGELRGKGGGNAGTSELSNMQLPRMIKTGPAGNPHETFCATYISAKLIATEGTIAPPDTFPTKTS